MVLPNSIENLNFRCLAFLECLSVHALCTTMRTLIFLALSLSLSSSFLPANMPPQLSTLNVTQCRLSAPPHITTRTRSFQEEHIGMHSEASNLSLLVSSGRRFTPEVFLFPKMGFQPLHFPAVQEQMWGPGAPIAVQPTITYARAWLWFYVSYRYKRRQKKPPLPKQCCFTRPSFARVQLLYVVCIDTHVTSQAEATLLLDTVSLAFCSPALVVLGHDDLLHRLTMQGVVTGGE